MRIIDRGVGPALVLIPGIQGRWEYVEPAVEALAQAFRVITFALCDEPASGLKPDGSREFDNHVEQVRGALDQCGIHQAIVCGISFGGLVALRFAARCQDRTGSLVLASTPGPGGISAAVTRSTRGCPTSSVPCFLPKHPGALGASWRPLFRAARIAGASRVRSR